MKKKLLFVIPSLHLGGAEKSFVNLLNVLDYEKYDVDVFLLSRAGFFLSHLPEHVTILQESPDFNNFSKPFYKSISCFLLRPRHLVYKILFTIQNRLEKNRVLAEQKSWKYLKHFFPDLPKEYDVAIGYLEKTSNYFTIEKTNAKKKIGWIHTDLESLGIDFEIETPVLRKFNYVVTVSTGLSERLSNKLPSIKDRIKTIGNINSKSIISKLAAEPAEIKFDRSCYNIIFVGRVAQEKGLFLALAAVHDLVSKGYNICFYLIGSGNQEKVLKIEAAEKGISSSIIFLGNQRNPYQYMKQADLFLMTSFYEGKSIALEEAKLIQIPIVVTKFSSAEDQILQGETGVIVDMNAEAISTAIEGIMLSKSTQEKFKNNLSKLTGNETEVEKLYRLIND